MKAVIMAGGRGTRIESVVSNVPKPMISISGKPILEWEIINLREQGFKDFIITLSYLADQIISYFGNGHSLGVHIDYYVEQVPLGTAGALFKIREMLTDDFLLLNADAMFDIDFKRFVDFHYRKGRLVTLFTHPNSHPYDSGIIIADSNGCVEKWLAKEEIHPKWYKNRVNAGIHIINPCVLDLSGIIEAEIGVDCNGEISKVDLDRQILKPLSGTGELYCYDSSEYVKDMGTPDRYKEVCKDFSKGYIRKKNLRNKQKAIFIDRDGTINKYVGFLRNIYEFDLLEGVAEAIAKINRSGYLAIIITNQPVISRGEVTILELELIHNKMETLLGEKGAYVDAIYYCPHHPHKGYSGEISELKIDCECRKPKPGMLLKAAEDFNIDLHESWMVGDSKDDIMAGQAANCKTAFIGTENNNQTISVRSLYDFTQKVFVD